MEVAPDAGHRARCSQTAGALRHLSATYAARSTYTQRVVGNLELCFLGLERYACAEWTSGGVGGSGGFCLLVLVWLCGVLCLLLLCVCVRACLLVAVHFCLSCVVSYVCCFCLCVWLVALSFLTSPCRLLVCCLRSCLAPFLAAGARIDLRFAS